MVIFALSSVSQILNPSLFHLFYHYTGLEMLRKTHPTIKFHVDLSREFFFLPQCDQTKKKNPPPPPKKKKKEEKRLSGHWTGPSAVPKCLAHHETSKHPQVLNIWNPVSGKDGNKIKIKLCAEL